MERDKSLPEIVVSYYDTKKYEKENPKQLAKRCHGEMSALCEKLALTTSNLVTAPSNEDVSDGLSLCEYYYEYGIVKIYSLRERAWDTLAVLVNVPRVSTSKKHFRQNVLDKLKGEFPELKKSFEKFLAIIDTDWEYRNVATHETLLFLSVQFPNEGDIYEADSVIMWHDPDSSGGKEIQAMLKGALERFVKRTSKHFQEVIEHASQFQDICSNAIDNKSW